jgi:hypothetical protein
MLCAKKATFQRRNYSTTKAGIQSTIHFLSERDETEHLTSYKVNDKGTIATVTLNNPKVSRTLAVSIAPTLPVEAKCPISRDVI